MTVTLSITETDVTTALRTVLLAIVQPGTEIALGQDNYVPEPQDPNFIVMTPTFRSRFNTNVDTWALNIHATQMDHEQSTQADVQLDIHGPNSTDNAQMISTLFRDEYAAAAFTAINPSIQPLYADDGHQVPFINGENQYETRWVMNVSMQVNPVVSTTEPFADSLTIGVIEVDERYPP